MNIQNKIEEIRRQPEHIRMRYVLGSVSISMVLIGILWIFSLTTSLQNQVGGEGAMDLMNYRTVPGAPAASEVSVPSDQPAPSLNEWIKK